MILGESARIVGIDLLSRDQSAPEGLSHTRHLVNESWDRQRFFALSGYQSKRKMFLPPSRSIDLFGLFPRAFVKQDLPVFTKTVRNNQPLERFLQRLHGEFLPFALMISRSPQKCCAFGLIYYQLATLPSATNELSTVSAYHCMIDQCYSASLSGQYAHREALAGDAR